MEKKAKFTEKDNNTYFIHPSFANERAQQRQLLQAPQSAFLLVSMRAWHNIVGKQGKPICLQPLNIGCEKRSALARLITNTNEHLIFIYILHSIYIYNNRSVYSRRVWPGDVNALSWNVQKRRGLLTTVCGCTSM